MNDDPLENFASHDRVSIRAVLVRDGEDASAALADAGIIDAIAIPVMLDDGSGFSSGMPEHGHTPNLIGLLETEHEEAQDQPAAARQTQQAGQPEQPGATTMLPAAFGMQPLAPVRKISQAAGETQSATDLGNPAPFQQDYPGGRAGAGSNKRGLADTTEPSNSSTDPFHLTQQEIERRYYNESFLGMPVTQNQHLALQESVFGFATAGGTAGLLIGAMTEGAEVGSLGGPAGMAAGAAIGLVIGGATGLMVGSAVGTQQDKAQGIPALFPSSRP